MFNAIWKLIILLGLCFSCPTLAQRVDGPYTKIIASLPFNAVHPLPGTERIFKCLSSKQDPLLIGAFHQTIFKVPFEKVIQVYENYEAYTEFFSSFKKMKMLQGKPNFLISVEGIVPYPFIPNSHYDLWYDSKPASSPNTAIYTCQLSKSKDLVSMDGLTMFKKISDQETSFTELDFISAHWGIAKTLSPKTIWKDTIRGLAVGDFELKMRLETPTKSAHDIRRDAQFSVSSDEIDHCIDQKVDAQAMIDQLH